MIKHMQISITNKYTWMPLIALLCLGNMLQSEEAASTNCEKGSMAEVYACLEEKRQSSLDAVYTSLVFNLTLAEQFDALESLIVSQRAWSESVGTYCDILIDAATPDYGLYANDIGNNCRADLYSRRAEDLSRLIEAVQNKNFNYWTTD